MAEINQNMQRLFRTAGTGQAQQGTGYTNLGRIMEASKGNVLGEKVAGDISTQIGGVQSQLAEQQKQFKEEAEKSKVGGQADVEKREAILGRFASPSGTAPTGPSEEETSAFERYRSGQYGGPQSLKDTSALKTTAQQLQGQVSSFSPSGTKELLRRSVGGDRYTQGQSRLDALLMNRQALTPIARQAQGLGQEISRADLAASGEAELNKNLAQQFAKETQEKLTGSMGGIETDVQKRLAEAQLAEGTRQANIAKIQKFQQDAASRGGGDTYSQMQNLQKMLRESGANPEEIAKVLGTADFTKAGAVRSADLARKEAYKDIAIKPLLGKRGESGWTMGAGYGGLGDLSGTTEQQAQERINQWNQMTAKYGPGAFYGAGEIADPQIRAQIARAQSQIESGLGGLASKKFGAETGQAGQAILGGTQEQFYKDLATRLASAPGAQNLTEQGLASAQQRASYEALNKLLGRTSSEAKYKTVQQQIDPLTGKPIEDTSFYKAGQYKLT